MTVNSLISKGLTRNDLSVTVNSIEWLQQINMSDAVKKGRGRPPGIAREGTYGTGIKTKVVRVPEDIANNIPEILAKFEQIKIFVDSWDGLIDTAAKNSSKGKASPRYDKAIVMLEELREYLGK